MTDEDRLLNTPIGRRAMLSGGLTMAGLAAYASSAGAQTTGGDPLIEFGADYEIDVDANSDLVIRHQTNGDILKYDASSDKFSSSKDFTSITTGQANIGTSPSGVETVGQIGPHTDIITSSGFTLVDDASQTLISDFISSTPALVFAHTTTGNDGVIVATAGGNAAILEATPDADWSVSDTDGDNCIFRDGSNNLILKNRGGSSRQYHVTLIHLDAE